MSTLQKMPEIPLEAMQRIDEIRSKHSLASVDVSSAMAATFALAQGVMELEDAITDDMMIPIMKLKNKGFGFKTDERDGSDRRKEIKYTVAQVKQCLIEAMLWGLLPMNNEFNILAGGMYIAKNGIVRITRQYKGVEDVKDVIAIRQQNDKGATAAYKITWRQKGQDEAVEGIVAIKADKWTTADAVLGKATRKAFKRAYDRMANIANKIAPADGEVEEGPIGGERRDAKGGEPWHATTGRHPATDRPAPEAGDRAGRQPSKPKEEPEETPRVEDPPEGFEKDFDIPEDCIPQ